MNTINKTAFIFPGQGAQYPGMGKDVYDKYPEARAVYEKADDALNFSISRRCFEGPEEELKLTENTQPAILTTSIALLRVLQKYIDIRPDFVAGHSLGEYSALVCSEALTFEDAVVSVQKRGKFMQESLPPGTGTMAAVIKISEEKVRELCGRVSHEGHIVVNANINCPGQYVISGHTEAVQEVSELAKAAGAITIPLAVSAPFHSPLMKKAADELENWLKKISFNDLKIPLITNATTEIIHTAAEAGTSLVQQMQAPVKWEASVRKLIANGAGTFVEIGPGKVLSGLLKRIDRSVNILHVSDIPSLENAVKNLK
ncbi:MAG: ACP S-malonyltransferase [Fidelibacterota bacterium]